MRWLLECLRGGGKWFGRAAWGAVLLASVGYSGVVFPCSFTLSPEPVHDIHDRNRKIWEFGTTLTIHVTCGSTDPQFLKVYVNNPDSSYANHIFFDEFHGSTATFSFTPPSPDAYTLLVNSANGMQLGYMGFGRRPQPDLQTAVCEPNGNVYPAPPYWLKFTGSIIDPDPPSPEHPVYGGTSGTLFYVSQTGDRGGSPWNQEGSAQYVVSKKGIYTASLQGSNAYYPASASYGFGIESAQDSIKSVVCANIPPVAYFQSGDSGSVGQ
ncbi:MAG: hypothetical protein HUU37_09985, partial [Bdellovibrionales bacterium]|nr:hypothetical protein [Bdellovibrionales bacterium]